MKFRKKPVVVEAAQWFKNGDHPEDACSIITISDGSFLSEGKVVGYLRNPGVCGSHHCRHCGEIMHFHGWIDTLEGGHIVCPGDYVITGIHGEHYPCKPEIFHKTYEPIEDQPPDTNNS